MTFSQSAGKSLLHSTSKISFLSIHPGVRLQVESGACTFMHVCEQACQPVSSCRACEVWCCASRTSSKTRAALGVQQVKLKVCRRFGFQKGFNLQAGSGAESSSTWMRCAQVSASVSCFVCDLSVPKTHICQLLEALITK